MGQAVEIQVRAAHALLRADRTVDAAQALAPALERMRVEGERGHALMCGPDVLATLAEARWGMSLSTEQLAELHAAAALATTLRDGGRSAMAATSAPAATTPMTIVTSTSASDAEPLSTREREVLELIAAGDSNKLIARSLDISPHTVKRHVANILDKLGLASRGQASAWLRTNA